MPAIARTKRHTISSERSAKTTCPARVISLICFAHFHSQISSTQVAGFSWSCDFNGVFITHAPFIYVAKRVTGQAIAFAFIDALFVLLSCARQEPFHRGAGGRETVSLHIQIGCETKIESDCEHSVAYHVCNRIRYLIFHYNPQTLWNVAYAKSRVFAKHFLLFELVCERHANLWFSINSQN